VFGKKLRRLTGKLLKDFHSQTKLTVEIRFDFNSVRPFKFAIRVHAVNYKYGDVEVAASPIPHRIPAAEPAQLGRVKAGPSLTTVTPQQATSRGSHDFQGFPRSGRA
jgi:hypothetical protein